MRIVNYITTYMHADVLSDLTNLYFSSNTTAQTGF